jgi:ribosome recycling factor
MGIVVEHLRVVFRGISTGRARSALLEHIRVDAYGQPTPLHHVAMVGGGPDGRTLRVHPHDRSLLGTICKAILKANLGLNPQVGGDSLLVKVPSLDDDQRVKLCSRVRKLAEEQRVAIRNVRKDTRNRAKREKTFKQIQKPLEALTKAAIVEIDGMLEGKLEAINWLDPKWNR